MKIRDSPIFETRVDGVVCKEDPRKKKNDLAIEIRTGPFFLPTLTLHYSGEILQNHRKFALFKSPQMGNLITPVGSRVSHWSRGI